MNNVKTSINCPISLGLLFVRVMLLSVLLLSGAAVYAQSGTSNTTQANILPVDSALENDAIESYRLRQYRWLHDPEQKFDAASAGEFFTDSSIVDNQKDIVFTGRNYWVWLPLKNLSQREDWMFTAPMSMLHEVEAWWVPKKGEPSHLAVNNSADIPLLTFLFTAKVPLAAGAEGHLLLRMQGDVTARPRVYIETPRKVRRLVTFHLVSLFVCTGAMLAMLLYCLMLTFALRNWVYLFYCLFAVCQIVLMTRVNGVGVGALVNDRIALGVSGTGVPVFALIFTLLLVRPANPPRLLQRLVIGAILFNFGFAILWFSSETVSTVFAVFPFPALLTFTFAVILTASCMRYYPPARLVFIAWTVLIFGHLVTTLGGRQPFVDIQITPLGLAFGGVAEMLLLSLAVGLSVRQALVDKNVAISHQQHAEAFAKQRAEFVATVSHELSTPLHVVLGTINRLDHQPLPAEARDAVSELKYAGEALYSLTDSLLGYSAAEAHAADQIRRFSPARLIAAVSGLFEARASAHDLAIRRQCTGVMAPVNGPAPAIRRVLINLVSNAVKYCRNGEVTVTAEMIERDGKALLQCAVSDEGPGMPTEVLRSINAEQLSAGEVEALYSDDPSNGLGLRITQALIAEMGGDIVFSNRNSGGLQVQFSVPVTEAESEFGYSDKPLEGRWALVVDDLVSNLSITCGYLHQLGCKTVTAENAVTARAILSDRDDLDLLVTDHRMEGGDGMQLVTWLRNQSQEKLRNLPALIATAHISQALKEGSKRERCGLLAKPFDEQKLLEQLASVGLVAVTALATAKVVADEARGSANHGSSIPLMQILDELQRDLGSVATTNVLSATLLQTRDDMAELRKQLQGSAYDSENAPWRAVAHRIASASGTLRVLPVRDAALRVETADLAGARSHLPELESELKAMSEAIERFMAASC